MVSTFPFELKSIDATGEFTGLTATYSEVDLGGDSIQPGAFAKTLADKGNSRPLMFDHKIPCGRVQLEDTPKGLVAHGKLSMGLQQGRDCYTMLRDQILDSMSIGYTTITERMKGSVRELHEVKLWECSLVLFPMNPSARVQTIKADQDRKIQLALAELRREITNL